MGLRNDGLVLQNGVLVAWESCACGIGFDPHPPPPTRDFDLSRSCHDGFFFPFLFFWVFLSRYYLHSWVVWISWESGLGIGIDSVVVGFLGVVLFFSPSLLFTVARIYPSRTFLYVVSRINPPKVRSYSSLHRTSMIQCPGDRILKVIHEYIQITNSKTWEPL